MSTSQSDSADAPAAGLAGVVFRVPDPGLCASFYEQVFGARVVPGPLRGWSTVECGWGQALWLVPGGRSLPVLGDRWERQGIIPILRTFDLDAVVAAAETAGCTWVNQVFDYQMMGTGHLGYLHDPARQTVGVQARDQDSVREEDLAAADRRAAEPHGLAAGIGWLILQADDIVAARDFYGSALGWTLLRGTDGFGYMHAVTPTTTLQIAYRGRLADPGRDLAEEPTLPVLGAGAAVHERFRAAGGCAARSPVDGLLAMTDPQGTAWLLDCDGVLATSPRR